MNKSISTRWATILGVMIIVLLLIGLVINQMFFYDYYVKQEKKSMLKFAEQLDQHYDEDSEAAELIDRYILRNQASIQLIDANEHFHFSFGMFMNSNFKGRSPKMGSMIKIPQDAADRLTEDGYYFFDFEHSTLRTNLMALIYKLHSGDILMITVPFEEFTRTANYTIQFNIYVAGALILIGMMVVYFLAKRMTKPIVSLSSMTQKIADLDFTERYEGSEEDEIGHLGRNINVMSEALEKSLINLKVANENLMDDLKEKDKLVNMRKSFLANISHELKTPIALIMSYTEGLRGNETLDEKKKDYYFDVIEKEASHMDRLVKDLLDLAELEYDAFKLNLSYFDLSSLIDEIMDRYILLISEKKINITYEKDDIIQMHGDKKRIEQVVSNLIVNALEHTELNGTVKIAVRHEDTITFSIENSGSRIPEEMLDNLFNIFYKSQQNQEKRIGGSGIGLSIVKAVIDKHGGTCGVKNLENSVAFWFNV